MKRNNKDRLSYLYNKYENIKYPSIFTIIVLLSCFLSLYTLQEQIGIEFRIIFYILVYLGAQDMSNVINELKRRYIGFFDRFILFIICMLATFFETGAYYLEPIYINLVPVISYFALSAVWVSVIVLFLINKLNNWLEIQNIVEEKGFSIKANLFLFITCITLCMLCNYAFNPAITSPDSQDCYSNAFRLGEESIPGGHPVFYIILLKLCTYFTSNIQFMIWIQIVYYAIILTYTMNILVQIGVSKKTCVVIFVFVGIGFNTIIQMATLWKDIPFTISLLWFTALLIKMCIHQEKCSKGISWYVQYIIAAVLTSMIRHNGMLPVAATLILALILLRQKKKILIATVITASIIFIIKGPIYSKFQIDEEPGLKFYAMANDILYLYYYGECDDVLMPVVNDVTDGNPIGFDYNPYYTHVNREGLNHYSVPEFLGIYLHAWRSQPKMMLRGFLKRNAVIWSIDKTCYESVGCVNYLGEYHDAECQEQYPERKPNYFTEKLTALFSKLTNNRLFYTLYWRTAIYHLLMIIVMGLVVIRFKTRCINYILPFIPISTNVISLSLTSGWPDYRYYWPSMLVASIVIPYALILLVKKNK